MARRLTLLLAAMLAGASLPARAADLPLRDPTRPADASAADGDDMPSSGLQSIIRPMNEKAGGKPRAIIDGQLVGIGGKVGDATVIAIGTDRVVLKNADGSSETRFLTPGIDKKPVRSRISSHSSNVSRQP